MRRGAGQLGNRVVPGGANEPRSESRGWAAVAEPVAGGRPGTRERRITYSFVATVVVRDARGGRCPAAIGSAAPGGKPCPRLGGDPSQLSPGTERISCPHDRGSCLDRSRAEYRGPTWTSCQPSRCDGDLSWRLSPEPVVG